MTRPPFWYLSIPLLLILSGAIPSSAQPTFTDAAAIAGVRILHSAGVDPPDCSLGGGFFCEPDRMSGAVAIGDYDGDGFQDILLTRIRNSVVLLRNQQNGTFADATEAAGLTTNYDSNGAAWCDIDNDGDQDLYVTGIDSGRYFLYLNDGSGRFTEEALARGAAVEVPVGLYNVGYSVSFGDYDRDGWPDAHTCEWFGITEQTHSRLLRNLGAGSPGFFEDTTNSAGLLLRAVGGAESVFSFSSCFADMDGDGWQDIAISGDFGNSRLFWNERDGTFLDGSVDAALATEENGMGSTLGDYDNDGDIDWFVTSIFDPEKTCDEDPCNWGYTGNRLHRNDGGRVFADRTSDAGVRAAGWGWGAGFLDYDNDGDLDLTMTNGVRFPGTDVEIQYNLDPMRFWRNDGDGSFTDVSVQVGVVDTGSGKGLAVFDYEEDGDLDVFVVNNCDFPILYRNDGGNEAGGWLRVKVRGTRSNRDGLGARVMLQATPDSPVQLREIGAGSQFLAWNEKTAHFGLGAGSAPVFRLTVKWPASGAEQVFQDIPRNQVFEVVEPAE